MSDFKAPTEYAQTIQWTSKSYVKASHTGHCCKKYVRFIPLFVLYHSSCLVVIWWQGGQPGTSPFSKDKNSVARVELFFGWRVGHNLRGIAYQTDYKRLTDPCPDSLSLFVTIFQTYRSFDRFGWSLHSRVSKPHSRTCACTDPAGEACG